MNPYHASGVCLDDDQSISKRELDHLDIPCTVDGRLIQPSGLSTIASDGPGCLSCSLMVRLPAHNQTVLQCSAGLRLRSSRGQAVRSSRQKSLAMPLFSQSP